MNIPNYESAVVIDSRGPREKAISRQNTAIAKWSATGILFLLLGAGLMIFIARNLNEPRHELDANIGKILTFIAIGSVIPVVVSVSKALKAWKKKQTYL